MPTVFRRFSFVTLLLFLLVSLESSAQRDTLSVYILKGCVRCMQAEAFLKNHKIPYRAFYNEVEKDHRQLATLLNAVGFGKGELTFPVVVDKEKTHYNIPDLEKFLNSLLKQSE